MTISIHQKKLRNWYLNGLWLENYTMHVTENSGRLHFFLYNEIPQKAKLHYLTPPPPTKKIKTLFILNSTVITLRKCIKIIISSNVVAKIHKILYRLFGFLYKFQNNCF